MTRTRLVTPAVALAVAGLLAACESAPPTAPAPRAVSLETGRSAFNASACATDAGLPTLTGDFAHVAEILSVVAFVGGLRPGEVASLCAKLVSAFLAEGPARCQTLDALVAEVQAIGRSARPGEPIEGIIEALATALGILAASICLGAP